jgi:TPR repeat protein
MPAPKSPLVAAAKHGCLSLLVALLLQGCKTPAPASGSAAASSPAPAAEEPGVAEFRDAVRSSLDEADRAGDVYREMHGDGGPFGEFFTAFATERQALREGVQTWILAPTRDREALERRRHVIDLLTQATRAIGASPKTALGLFAEAFDAGSDAAALMMRDLSLVVGGASDAKPRPRFQTFVAAWGQRGMVNDLFAVGTLYALGAYVEQSSSTALSWFERGAERGDASCQTMAAFFLVGGRGVPANRARARMWLEKAAAQGDAQAADYLRQLKAKS